MTLSQHDQNFTDLHQQLWQHQQRVFEELRNYSFNLTDSEITDAVIARMDAFWLFHVNNCRLLDRKTNTTAADAFTETCLLFIKSYFEQKGLKVVSEKDIRKEKPDRRRIQPDISIWQGEECKAVIELKVSAGYKGKYIMAHLEERERQIKAIYPDLYFGAIAFWNIFPTDTPEWDKKYVGLRTWDAKKNPRTGARIESLLQAIDEALEK